MNGELIKPTSDGHLEPENNFEIIKNMSFDEMADSLLSMLYDIIEDGVPSSEMMKEWLKAKPIKD